MIEKTVLDTYQGIIVKDTGTIVFTDPIFKLLAQERFQIESTFKLPLAGYCCSRTQLPGE